MGGQNEKDWSRCTDTYFADGRGFCQELLRQTQRQQIPPGTPGIGFLDINI
jgi:hypothetical protein